MDTVFTCNAPKPAGHYSQAIVHNGIVYISGQLPVKPETGEKQNGSIEEQAEQALSNLDAILLASGSDRNHVLKTTVYISNIELWSRINEVYSKFFGDHKPARSIVPTRELHFGLLIEMDAIAAQK